MIILMIFRCLRADDLVFRDYVNNQIYSWGFLKLGNPYVLDLGDFFITAALGEHLDQDCEGQKASVVKFSKTNNDCEVLGDHETASYSSFYTLSNPGVQVEYIQDLELGKKTVFLFVCSQEEHDFVFVQSFGKAKTMIKKYSKAGCPEELIEGPFSKTLMFL